MASAGRTHMVETLPPTRRQDRAGVIYDECASKPPSCISSFVSVPVICNGAARFPPQKILACILYFQLLTSASRSRGFGTSRELPV